MNQEERWYVLGAGAIGSLLCHQLRSRHYPVTLLQHHAGNAIRRLDDGGHTHQLEVQSIHACPPGSVSRLLLTSKAGQLVDAMSLAKPFLTKDAVLVTTANGLGFERDIDQRHPELCLFRAVSTAAAYRRDTEHIVMAAEGTTLVGAPGSSMSAPDWFEDSLASLPGWTWSAPIDTALGRKFALNCVINPLTATRQCRNGELLQEGQAIPELAALCQESEPVLRHVGLWQSDEALLDAAIAVCNATAHNQSSMLQDVLAGRATEISYLNVELLRRARPLAMSLPLNEQLVEQLHQQRHQRRHQ